MILRPALVVLLAAALLMPVDVSAQTKDDTLVYALQSDLQTWDPPNSVLRESIILGYHVFDHLAARDLKTGKVGPSLAVSWKNVDDSTWEVKLRPNVKFHDGTPFSAKDVKATFERVLDPNLKLTYRPIHIKIKSVEIVDDLTVRFKTDGPYPLFVERLTAQVMQSEKAIREKGHEWLQENPLGTGPYKLVKWTKQQEHVLFVWNQAVDKTGGYFYSRLLLAVINGTGMYITLRAFSVPFAAPLAIFEGLVSEFIPIVGTYIAGAAPVFVALLSSPAAGIAALAYVLIYQQIENYWLSPRLTAKTMALHPAVAFAAALIGGAIGGILTAFLALPVAAVAQAAIAEYGKKYTVVEDDLTAHPDPPPPREHRTGRLTKIRRRHRDEGGGLDHQPVDRQDGDGSDT